MIYEYKQYTTPEAATELFAPERFANDLDMGEWSVSEQQLATSGVATCIVLAAHNQLTSRGLLGHFSAISFDEGEPSRFNNRQSFLDAIAGLPSLGEPAQTDVWLGGAAPALVDGKEYGTDTDKLEAEIAVLQYLDEYSQPEDRLRKQWSPQSNTVLAVELDCPSGKLVCHSYPSDDEFMLSAIRSRQRRSDKG